MNSRLNFPFAERTRPLGLGGTDIGAILGLSPYKTPLELWSELVSLIDQTANHRKTQGPCSV